MLRRPTAAATKITKFTKFTKNQTMFFVVFVDFVIFVPLPSARFSQACYAPATSASACLSDSV